MSARSSVLVWGTTPIRRLALAGCAHTSTPPDVGPARGRDHPRGQHAGGGRLARAVRPEQAEDLASVHGEVEAVDGLDVARVHLREIHRADHLVSQRRRGGIDGGLRRRRQSCDVPSVIGPEPDGRTVFTDERRGTSRRRGTAPRAVIPFLDEEGPWRSDRTDVRSRWSRNWRSTLGISTPHIGSKPPAGAESDSGRMGQLHGGVAPYRESWPDLAQRRGAWSPRVKSR